MAGETRQKILDATQKLIQLRGLSRVTTKEIARETGLSEGALYRHFEHKEEVFFAIIAQHLPTLLGSFGTHLPGTADIQTNLKAIMLAAMDYFGKLIPMSASFLADTKLLAQYRKKLSQIAEGPIAGGPKKSRSCWRPILRKKNNWDVSRRRLRPKKSPFCCWVRVFSLPISII